MRALASPARLQRHVPARAVRRLRGSRTRPRSRFSAARSSSSASASASTAPSTIRSSPISRPEHLMGRYDGALRTSACGSSASWSVPRSEACCLPDRPPPSGWRVRRSLCRRGRSASSWLRAPVALRGRENSRRKAGWKQGFPGTMAITPTSDSRRPSVPVPSLPRIERPRPHAVRVWMRHRFGLEPRLAESRTFAAPDLDPSFDAPTME